jgi:hypothetical protein
MGMVEPARTGPEGSPLDEEDTVARELLDAVVAGVDHVDVALGVDLDPPCIPRNCPSPEPMEPHGRKN